MRKLIVAFMAAIAALVMVLTIAQPATARPDTNKAIVSLGSVLDVRYPELCASGKQYLAESQGLQLDSPVLIAGNPNAMMQVMDSNSPFAVNWVNLDSQLANAQATCSVPLSERTSVFFAEYCPAGQEFILSEVGADGSTLVVPDYSLEQFAIDYPTFGASTLQGAYDVCNPTQSLSAFVGGFYTYNLDEVNYPICEAGIQYILGLVGADGTEEVSDPYSITTFFDDYLTPAGYGNGIPGLNNTMVTLCTA